MTISDLSPGLVTPENSVCIRARVVELPPGEEVGEHTTHDNEEIIIILEGTASVISQGEAAIASKGQAVFIGQGEVHNIRNECDGILRYMYVRSRGGSHDQASGGCNSHGY
jgi:quercetin dioxygenase-like cupin family protein